eukprot:2790578-Rhodomonas_salina.7
MFRGAIADGRRNGVPQNAGAGLSINLSPRLLCSGSPQLTKSSINPEEICEKDLRGQCLEMYELYPFDPTDRHSAVNLNNLAHPAKGPV